MTGNDFSSVVLSIISLMFLITWSRDCTIWSLFVGLVDVLGPTHIVIRISRSFLRGCAGVSTHDLEVQEPILKGLVWVSLVWKSLEKEL